MPEELLDSAYVWEELRGLLAFYAAEGHSNVPSSNAGLSSFVNVTLRGTLDNKHSRDVLRGHVRGFLAVMRFEWLDRAALQYQTNLKLVRSLEKDVFGRSMVTANSPPFRKWCVDIAALREDGFLPDCSEAYKELDAAGFPWVLRARNRTENEHLKVRGMWRAIGLHSVAAAAFVRGSRCALMTFPSAALIAPDRLVFSRN